MILTREQALKKSGRNFTTLKLPEMDGELRLGSLMAGAAIRFSSLKSKFEANKEDEIAAREMMIFVIQAAVVDEEGGELFDATSAAQLIDTKLSFTSAMKLITSVPKSGEPEVVPGNSVASPSGA